MLGWGVNGSLVTLLPDTPLPLLEDPPHPSPSASSSSGLFSGAVVGIVVGSIVGAALFMLVVATVLLKRRCGGSSCGVGGCLSHGVAVGSVVGAAVLILSAMLLLPSAMLLLPSAMLLLPQHTSLLPLIIEGHSLRKACVVHPWGFKHAWSTPGGLKCVEMFKSGAAK